MIAAGETDIAIDELRWLLSGCADFIEAHRLLGELALVEGDLRLARGHFGFAHQLGLGAIPTRGLPGALSYDRLANQAFFEAAKGLARCLVELGKPEPAREVLAGLLRLDPGDPLALRAMLERLSNPKPAPRTAKPSPATPSPG